MLNRGYLSLPPMMGAYSFWACEFCHRPCQRECLLISELGAHGQLLRSENGVGNLGEALLRESIGTLKNDRALADQVSNVVEFTTPEFPHV
jgi:hypothetical protein